MKLNQSLNLKQVQTLKLTPQLQQAVKILQANRTELQEIIEQELLENPVLEIQSVTDDYPDEGDVAETQERDELLGYVREFEKYVVDTHGTAPVSESVSFEDKPALEEYVSSVKSLSDDLLEQYSLMINDPVLLKVGSYLIASLDHNGYLKESSSRIASALMVDEETVERALSLIQTLEPAGVGARDLKECLLVQYHQLELHDELVLRILQDHLEDLAANRLRDIAKATQADFEQIEAAAEKIRQLNPRPAQGLLSHTPSEAIVPDIFLEFKDGVAVVTLNDDHAPVLSISPWYQTRIQNAEGLAKDELTYLKQKLDAALWFRQCIEKRNETIYLVAKCIFEIQKDFFTQGVSGLKPLTLGDVAVRVERHEATVSRVVNGKYAQTPSGLFELKFFFSGGLRNDEGDLVSSRHIREILQKAISEEDPHRPISDQMLAQLMKARGIDIARRTVTKYREMMGIPSSSRRKKFV